MEKIREKRVHRRHLPVEGGTVYIGEKMGKKRICSNLAPFFFLSPCLYHPLSNFFPSQAILAAGSVMQECEDYDVALVKYRVCAGNKG